MSAVLQTTCPGIDYKGGLPGISEEGYVDVPEAMKQAKRWLVHRNKLPFYISGKPRSGTLDAAPDVAKLGTFEDAVEALRTGSYTGLGFALGPDGTGNYWQGIDLDHSSNHPELDHIVDNLPGYTERSLSGDGWHAIGYGRRFETFSQSKKFGIEVYSEGKYFATTGVESGLHDPCCIADFVERELAPIVGRGNHAAMPNVPLKTGQEATISSAEVVSPQTIEELRAALQFCDPDEYRSWTDTGQRLKSLGAIGFGLWDEWSKQSPKYDAGELRGKWRGFSGQKTSYRAIFKQAQDAGWINPLSNGATSVDDSNNPPTGYQQWTDPDTGETGFYDSDGLKWVPPQERLEKHPLANFLQINTTAKPPRWVIPGFIGVGVTVISGGHGAGKTTALLPLALTAAGLMCNSPSQTDLQPRHWRHVVYISEDTDQAERILAGVVQHGNLGINFSDVHERVHLVQAVRLNAPYVASVGKLYKHQFSRNLNGVEILPLVVLDTKSAVLVMNNENDNSEGAAIMAALKQGFYGLPVWLIGHIGKASMNRAETVSARGASSIEADANQTLYLAVEGGKRYLVEGKTRFEPRWPELLIESYTAETQTLDEFGHPESLTLRWGIAEPPQQTRKEAAEQAASLAKDIEAMTLRQDILEAVQGAWEAGEPLSGRSIRATIKRKTEDVVEAIADLLAEGRLYEVHVPSSIRANNSKKAFLVSLTDSERATFLVDGVVPDEKAEVPKSWRKAEIPVVPKNSDDATKNEPK